MARRFSAWLIVVLLAVLLVVPTQLAHADTPTPADTPTDTATPTDTPTFTPTPTGTPADQTALTLDSGNQLVIVRSWTFGELAIFLALVANMALYGLHWIYELPR